MCGIAGFYEFAKGETSQSSKFERVLQKEFSRGPDGESSYIEECVASMSEPHDEPR